MKEWKAGGLERRNSRVLLPELGPKNEESRLVVNGRLITKCSIVRIRKTTVATKERRDPKEHIKFHPA